MIRSTQLLAEHPGLNTAWLVRWRQHEWIVPVAVTRGSRGNLWPDWTARMVRMIVADKAQDRSNAGDAARSDLFRAVARWLAMYPDLPYVVKIDDALPIPAHDDDHLAALLAGVRVHAEIVSIPE